MTRTAGPPTSGTAAVEDPLWRGVDVFRTLSLLYAVANTAMTADELRRPALAWVAMAVMTAWTASFWLRPRPRRAATLVADLVLAAGLALLTLAVDTPARIAEGAPTLPTVWAATPVISFAVWQGMRGGLLAGLCIATVDVVVAGRLGGNTLHNNVLLVLLGSIVGYCADLFRRGHLALRQALAREAATVERERLARDIHDSVLQVLAFVQRRAREIGGPTEELGTLAGEQERRLRALVSSRPEPAGVSGPGGRPDVVDQRALVATDDPRTTVVLPADPVELARELAERLAAAVYAALDNVARHAGPTARAWVLVDDTGEQVEVTVRDDGAGFALGRLEPAADDGRLDGGLSVRGRLAELGGSADVRSTPGEGTEVRLTVPRRVAP
ncbi:DUF5931 domain-containing protein [Angustibacter peucedani]